MRQKTQPGWAFLRTASWFLVGFGATAAVVYAVACSPATMQIIASSRILGLGALIVGLGLALYLAARVQSHRGVDDARASVEAMLELQVRAQGHSGITRAKGHAPTHTHS